MKPDPLQGNRLFTQIEFIRQQLTNLHCYGYGTKHTDMNLLAVDLHSDAIGIRYSAQEDSQGQSALFAFGNGFVPVVEFACGQSQIAPAIVKRNPVAVIHENRLWDRPVNPFGYEAGHACSELASFGVMGIRQSLLDQR